MEYVYSISFADRRIVRSDVLPVFLTSRLSRVQANRRPRPRRSITPLLLAFRVFPKHKSSSHRADGNFAKNKNPHVRSMAAFLFYFDDVKLE